MLVNSTTEKSADIRVGPPLDPSHPTVFPFKLFDYFSPYIYIFGSRGWMLTDSGTGLTMGGKVTMATDMLQQARRMGLRQMAMGTSSSQSAKTCSAVC